MRWTSGRKGSKTEIALASACLIASGTGLVLAFIGGPHVIRDALLSTGLIGILIINLRRQFIGPDR